MYILFYVKLTWCSGISQIYGQLEGAYICHGYMCILLYGKLLQCGGMTQIYGQLEEGGPWCMCILLYLKLIQCSGISQLYGQLEWGLHLPWVHMYFAIW